MSTANFFHVDVFANGQLSGNGLRAEDWPATQGLLDPNVISKMR